MTHEFTYLVQHRLDDGSMIGICRHTVHDANGITATYSITLGITDRYISHAITGDPVPVTTDGCIYCDIWYDMALEIYDILVHNAHTIKDADRIGSKWWSDHMDHRINIR